MEIVEWRREGKLESYFSRPQWSLDQRGSSTNEKCWYVWWQGQEDLLELNVM